MNLEWMTTFMETARLGSLNKAAERLNMTQPAVSQQIRKLEDRLGVKLFNRTPTGVTLTEAGEAVLERSRLLMAEWQSLQQEVGAYQQDRRIAFGTLPSLAAAYLPRQVIHLKQRRILLDVHVAHTSEELQRLLKQGVVEAALLEQSYAGGFWSAELFAEPFYAVLPEQHPLAGRDAITVQELALEPLVANPPTCDIRRRVVHVLMQHGLKPQITLEVAFGEQVLGYVAAGAGIAVVPEMAVKQLLLPGLRALPISGFRELRHLAIAARSQKLGEQLRRWLPGQSG